MATIFGFECYSAGTLDPQGVMGKGDRVDVRLSDVVAVGLLKVYGRGGFRDLLKLRDGRLVWVPSEDQKTPDAKAFFRNLPPRLKPPMGDGFTAIRWVDLPQTCPRCGKRRMRVEDVERTGFGVCFSCFEGAGGSDGM